MRFRTRRTDGVEDIYAANRTGTRWEPNYSLFRGGEFKLDTQTRGARTHSEAQIKKIIESIRIE